MTNAYDAWKAAKIGTELDVLPSINEGIHAALTLAEAALREPAKLAVIEKWLNTYKLHLEDVIDADDDGLHLSDIGPAMQKALSEFDDPIPPTPPAAVMGRVPTAALDALKAMEHLNYTGEHTHFEVLADARQVLAAVMLGKPMPQLERFRCPSEFQTSERVKIRCQLQLPHEGFHRFVQSGDGKGADWSDEASTNPPKSYDEPEIALVDKIGVREDGTGAHCGVLATVDGKTVACMEPIFSEHSVHRSAGGRLYRTRPDFVAEGGV